MCVCGCVCVCVIVVCVCVVEVVVMVGWVRLGGALAGWPWEGVHLLCVGGRA